MQTFEKTLTANDTGETGGHQAGIHIPKSQTELIAFLPPLDPSVKNPDAWLEMTDETGGIWRFRYIYYNNKHHDEAGTRDEFRITHMTKYFRAAGAGEGDVMVISGEPGSIRHSISIRKADQPGPTGDTPVRIRLQGWRRVC
jgi:hypothetical protein